MHCIGQFAIDLAPSFTEYYSGEVFKPIANKLLDSVPRVQAHACASLSNLLESMPQEELKPYIKELVDNLVLMIRTGIPLIKEDAVICLSTVAESSFLDFCPFYAETINELIMHLRNPDYSGEVYHQFKAQIIEAIVSISHAVGIQNFKSISG